MDGPAFLLVDYLKEIILIWRKHFTKKINRIIYNSFKMEIEKFCRYSGHEIVKLEKQLSLLQPEVILNATKEVSLCAYFCPVGISL